MIFCKGQFISEKSSIKISKEKLYIIGFSVASGLLSWGHFISSTIIDLIAQILFKLN